MLKKKEKQTLDASSTRQSTPNVLNRISIFAAHHQRRRNYRIKDEAEAAELLALFVSVCQNILHSEGAKEEAVAAMKAAKKDYIKAIRRGQAMQWFRDNAASGYPYAGILILPN